MQPTSNEFIDDPLFNMLMGEAPACPVHASELSEPDIASVLALLDESAKACASSSGSAQAARLEKQACNQYFPTRKMIFNNAHHNFENGINTDLDLCLAIAFYNILRISTGEKNKVLSPIHFQTEMSGIEEISYPFELLNHSSSFELGDWKVVPDSRGANAQLFSYLLRPILLYLHAYSQGKDEWNKRMKIYAVNRKTGEKLDFIDLRSFVNSKIFPEERRAQINSFNTKEIAEFVKNYTQIWGKERKSHVPPIPKEAHRGTVSVPETLVSERLPSIIDELGGAIRKCRSQNGEYEVFAFIYNVAQQLHSYRTGEEPQYCASKYALVDLGSSFPEDLWIEKKLFINYILYYGSSFVGAALLALTHSKLDHKKLMGNEASFNFEFDSQKFQIQNLRYFLRIIDPKVSYQEEYKKASDALRDFLDKWRDVPLNTTVQDQSDPMLIDDGNPPVDIAVEPTPMELESAPAKTLGEEYSVLKSNMTSKQYGRVMRRYERLITRLLHLAKDNNSELVTQMIESRGNGHFDLQNLSKSAQWTQAIDRFIQSQKDPNEKQLALFLADRIRNFWFTQPEAPATTQLVSENQITQIAQTLVDLKKKRFMLYSTHLESILAGKQAEITDEIPCFLVSQNQIQVHVDLYKIKLDAFGEFQFISADENQAALGILASHCSSLESVDLGADREAASISSADLKKLEEIVKKSKELPFLLLDRRVLRLAGSPVSSSSSSSDSSTGDTSSSSPSDNDKKTKPGERTGKKRARASKDSDDETEDVQCRQRNKHDIKKPSKRRKLGEGQHLDLQVGQKFQAGKGGNLDIVPPQQSLQGNKEAIELTAENFWNQISVQSSEKISNKVAKEESIWRAIKTNEPLDYPILDRLAGLTFPNPDDFPLLNTLLKKYQIDLVNDVYAAHNQKVSLTLAPDMGLGKTFMYGEIYAQRVADGIKKPMMVLCPKSLVKPISEELARVFAESKLTAWKLHLLSGAPEAKQECLNEIKKLVSLNPDKSPAFFQLGFLLASLFSYDELKTALAPEFVARMLKARFYLTEPMLRKHLQKLSEREGALFEPVQCELKELLDELAQKGCSPAVLEQVRKGLENRKIDSDALMNLLRDASPLLLLYIEARILAIEPDRKSVRAPALYEQKSLEHLRSFDCSQIFGCNTGSEVNAALNKNANSAQIIITTLPAVKNLQMNSPAIWEKLEAAEIVIDEAQKVNKEGLKDNIFLQKWFKQLREKQGNQPPEITVVTATPFENSFTEIWNDFMLANNPQDFNTKTHDTLQSLYQDSLTKLIDSINPHSKHNDPEELAHSLMTSFANFHVMKKTVGQPLARRQLKTDTNVIVDWDGRVPKKIELNFEVLLYLEVSRLVDAILDKFKKRKIDNLNYANDVLKVLLHPDLAEATFDIKNNPKADELFRILKSGTNEEKNRLIARSPILAALFRSQKMREILKTRKPAIIVTHHILTANLIQAAAKHAFRLVKREPEIKIYHGQLKPDERAHMVTWFKDKTSKHLKILILLAKAGGLGLNLQEAETVFQTSLSYNPHADRQAVDRAVRVGSSGVRQIMVPKIDDLFLWRHLEAIRDEKESMEDFFWDDSDDVLTSYDLWAKRIACGAYHACLNNTKDYQKAQARLAKFREQLEWVRNNRITRKGLEELVQKVTPVPKSVPAQQKPAPQVVAPAPILRPAVVPVSDFLVINLPTTLQPEDVENIGLFCRINDSAPEVKQLVSAVTGNAPKFVINACLERISKKAGKMPDTGFCLQTFAWDNQHLVQTDLRGEAEALTVHLCEHNSVKSLLLKK